MSLEFELQSVSQCVTLFVSQLFIMFQRDPRAGAFLGGDRISGQDIRDQNGTLLAARI